MCFTQMKAGGSENRSFEHKHRASSLSIFLDSYDCYACLIYISYSSERNKHKCRDLKISHYTSDFRDSGSVH